MFDSRIPKTLALGVRQSVHHFSAVMLETAGTMDMDIEIKFVLGNQSYSIDVGKKHISQLKDLYKVLIKISALQHENAKMIEYAEKTLNIASDSVHHCADASPLVAQFKAVNQYAFSWLKQVHETYKSKDFGEVFEKFINN